MGKWEEIRTEEYAWYKHLTVRSNAVWMAVRLVDNGFKYYLYVYDGIFSKEVAHGECGSRAQAQEACEAALQPYIDGDKFLPSDYKLPPEQFAHMLTDRWARSIKKVIASFR